MVTSRKSQVGDRSVVVTMTGVTMENVTQWVKFFWQMSIMTLV